MVNKYVNTGEQPACMANIHTGLTNNSPVIPRDIATERAELSAWKYAGGMSRRRGEALETCYWRRISQQLTPWGARCMAAWFAGWRAARFGKNPEGKDTGASIKTRPGAS